jgi:hypothetical protein
MPKEYGTPGPRAVYPEICTSRSVASCGIEAQLLFDRLISQADDQGRLEGDALVIKALCVPLVGKLSVKGVDKALEELVGQQLVVRYHTGSHELVQIITWWRWQQSQRRAYPSRWPAPDGWADPVYGHGGDSPASYKVWLEALPKDPSPAPDSPQIAAQRGDSPQNAANRGESPQSAANRGVLARARGAQPGAVPSRAPSVPESLPKAQQDRESEAARAPSAEATGDGLVDFAASSSRSR